MRSFVCLVAGIVLWGGAGMARSAAPAPQVPFRVLFNNDCTNLLTCNSPYHPAGARPQPEDIPGMIRASVDEVAHGVDVALLSPGMGWIPWWPSAVYSDHYDWYEARMNERGWDLIMTLFDTYVRRGGDVVAPFVDQCRRRGIAPFISFRLNDAHHLENEKRAFICKFYADHPEYRIGPDMGDWNQKVQNWAIPEVRDYKFALIAELCRNYDLDGLELDFLRHRSFFRLDETTADQRGDIMTGFVARVRKLLDETARPEQHRYLCVRISDRRADHERVGVDVERFVEAGVDMVNLSNYYIMHQQLQDVDEIAALVPQTPVYYELEFNTQVWPLIKGYDGNGFRRATDEQLYTTAWLAWQRGANGISLFNFVYYRPFGMDQDLRGPFNEPPLHVLPLLGEPDRLARQDQYYFKALKDPYDAGRSKTHTMPMALTPAHRQAATPANLRLKVLHPGESDDPRPDDAPAAALDRDQWRVSVNGTVLTRPGSRNEPYPTPYQAGFGLPRQYLAWSVPRNLLRDGDNQVEVTRLSGDTPLTVRWLEITVPLGEKTSASPAGREFR